MAIEGATWTVTAFVALSLPPALLFMIARRSKRSEHFTRANIDSSSKPRRESICLQANSPTTAANAATSTYNRVTHQSPSSMTATSEFYLFLSLVLSSWSAFVGSVGVGAFLNPPCHVTVRDFSALAEWPFRPNGYAFEWKLGWSLLGTNKGVKDSSSRPRHTASNYLAGKVVWITGASSGLGEQIAISAAAGGAKGIILSGRRKDALDKVCQACEAARPVGSTDGGVSAFPFDVGELEFAEKEAADSAVEKFGRVDILVLNAGISTRGSVEETSLEVDQRVMAVNYFGAVGLAKGLLKNRESSSIGAADDQKRSTPPSEVGFVVINSVQGKFGLANRSSYAASKHALVGFFDCLRAEQAHRGVRVTSIFPGYIRTSLSLNALTADGTQHAQMDATTAAGRDPREVADEIWEAVARGKDEVVMGDMKTSMAVLLRTLAPRTLFRILSKRAQKSETGSK